MIAQCSITAGLAWLLARQLLGHQLPFFAPIAAIITLGLTYGQRLRRGVEVAIGVAVGVAVGDLWLVLFGTGVWQIMVVCAIAMSLATLLGAGQLMMTQAGVQSILVTVLSPNPGQVVNRWLDAVIGCTLALVVATVAPSGPYGSLVRWPPKWWLRWPQRSMPRLRHSRRTMRTLLTRCWTEPVLERWIWLISTKLPPRDLPLFVTPRSDAATCAS